MCHLFRSLRPVPFPGEGHGACRGPVEASPVGVQDAPPMRRVAARHTSVHMENSLMRSVQALHGCARGMLCPFGHMMSSQTIDTSKRRPASHPASGDGHQRLRTFIMYAAVTQRCSRGLTLQAVYHALIRRTSRGHGRLKAPRGSAAVVFHLAVVWKPCGLDIRCSLHVCPERPMASKTDLSVRSSYMYGKCASQLSLLQQVLHIRCSFRSSS